MNQILCFRTDDQKMRALSYEKSMCSHLPEWLLSERQGISVGKNVENRELKCTVDGNVNWWNHCKQKEKKKKPSMEVPQKIKNRAVIWSSNSTLGYKSQENENTDLKIHELQYSQQHNLQLSKYDRKLTVHEPMNG